MCTNNWAIGPTGNCYRTAALSENMSQPPPASPQPARYSLASILLLTAVVAIYAGALRAGIVAAEASRRPAVGIGAACGLIAGFILGIFLGQGADNRARGTAMGALSDRFREWQPERWFRCRRASWSSSPARWFCWGSRCWCGGFRAPVPRTTRRRRHPAHRSGRSWAAESQDRQGEHKWFACLCFGRAPCSAGSVPVERRAGRRAVRSPGRSRLPV